MAKTPTNISPSSFDKTFPSTWRTITLPCDLDGTLPHSRSDFRLCSVDLPSLSLFPPSRFDDEKTMLRLGRLAFLFAATISIVSAQSTSTVAEGSLVGGPSEQGTCQRLESRTDIFECSNGSTCRWQSSSLNFLCTGGQSEGGTNGATADAETGPPGRECESHGDHWDCSDGSLCEIVEGAWMCEGGSSSHEGESESSGTW